MYKMILLGVILSLAFANAVQAQSRCDLSAKPFKKICDSEELNRIATQTVQYKNGLELTSANMLVVPDQENKKENKKWMSRHPVLFGTLVGFGVGFSTGLAMGGGSDVSSPAMGLYMGAIGAGAGALIGTVASN